MKPKTKPTRKPPPRNAHTLKALVDRLAKDVKGYKKVEPHIQAALAEMVWIGPTERRRHAVYAGYMTFHHQELAKWFGSKSKWEAVNERLKFLDVKDKWWSGSHTKGYRFSHAVAESREKFLETRPRRLSALLDANGKTIAKAPKAVVSLDKDGNGTSRWRAINDAGSLSLVPVNVESLRRYQKRISGDAEVWRRTGHPPPDLYLTYPSLEALLDLNDKVRQLIQLAFTKVAGRGHVMHHYQESKAGRLFTIGNESLQNVPREFRKAALVGLWDYDVSNCHPTIIAEMARRAGVQCDAIEHYLANKDDVRKEITDVIGISKDATKKCLLAVMYGAKSEAWYWYKNAIPDAIGIDAAKRLHHLPLFAKIAKDVKLARPAILAHTRLNRQGGLVNDFGKSIKAADHTEEQNLAHLVQGVEALALEACTELYPHDIILLQHDGFTATKSLDVAALDATIFKATRYALKIEEERIRPDLAKQYDSTAKSEFLKASSAKKPNALKHLRVIFPSPMTNKTELAPCAS